MNVQSQKEIEEILKLQVERKSIKVKTYFDIAKTMALIIGSIVLFWEIQRPESIVNQKAFK